jgi:glycosyltransferase involved in cell wall biosynthesis
VSELVSVVVPAYQAEAFLGEALESALGQDYDRVEIVVVDDGSTDRTE